MPVQTRGGVPRVFRATIDTTGRVHSPNQHQYTSYLVVRAATNPLKLYFTEADFTGDVNYVLVPVVAAETPYGEWQGPAEVTKVWLKGDGGNSDVELVAFLRRG